MKVIVNSEEIDTKDLGEPFAESEGRLFYYGNSVIKLYQDFYLKTLGKTNLQINQIMLDIDKKRPFQIYVPPKEIIFSKRGAYKGILMNRIPYSNGIERMRKMPKELYFQMLKLLYKETMLLAGNGIMINDEVHHDQFMFDKYLAIVDNGNYEFCPIDENAYEINLRAINYLLYFTLFDELGESSVDDDIYFGLNDLLACEEFWQYFIKRCTSAGYEYLGDFLIEDFGRANTPEEYVLKFK